MSQDLLSGLVSGYAQANQGKLEKQRNDEINKLRIKLFKQQIDAEENQKAAMAKVSEMFSGAMPPPDASGQQIGPPQKPKNLVDMLSDPQGSMALLQSGMVKPADILGAQQQQNVMGMLQGGGSGEFVPEGFKMGPEGQVMPDFTRRKMTREVPDPTGNEMIQLDQFGGQLGRRPVGPNERSETVKAAEGKQIAQEFKITTAMSSVDLAEQKFGEIINASSLEEKLVAIKNYNDFIGGVIAPIVRAGGESGSLAKEDVERAIGLVPNGFFGLTKYSADKLGKPKFNDLRKWFEGLKGKGAAQGQKVIDFSELPD